MMRHEESQQVTGDWGGVKLMRCKTNGLEGKDMGHYCHAVECLSIGSGVRDYRKGL